jgi:Protein of unknown function (DUF3307)
MTAIFFGLLLGFEVKHFIADYLMQPGWILGGKGDMSKLGGYVHAAIHGVFSVIVLLIFSTPLWLIGTLFVAECIVHYVLDFAKIRYSQGIDIEKDAGRYWALHGVDQLLHQLTYAAMIYAVVRVEGFS